MPAAGADIIVIPHIFHISGIEEVHAVIFAECGTGVSAVHIEGLIAEQHNGALFPAEQIG